MPLVDEIKKRVLSAMKAKNTVEKEVLRVALGEIQVVEARSGSVTDEQAQAIVRKLVKSNQETLELSASEDQKATLKEEIAVLESLLPKSLSADEIASQLAPVAAAIQGAGNAGQATGIAMKHLKAAGLQVGGKDVASAVELLRRSTSG